MNLKKTLVIGIALSLIVILAFSSILPQSFAFSLGANHAIVTNATPLSNNSRGCTAGSYTTDFCLGFGASSYTIWGYSETNDTVLNGNTAFYTVSHAIYAGYATLSNTVSVNSSTDLFAVVYEGNIGGAGYEATTQCYIDYGNGGVFSSLICTDTTTGNAGGATALAYLTAYLDPASYTLYACSQTSLGFNCLNWVNYNTATGRNAAGNLLYRAGATTITGAVLMPVRNDITKVYVLNFSQSTGKLTTAYINAGGGAGVKISTSAGTYSGDLVSATCDYLFTQTCTIFAAESSANALIDELQVSATGVITTIATDVITAVGAPNSISVEENSLNNLFVVGIYTTTTSLEISWYNVAFGNVQLSNTYSTSTSSLSSLNMPYQQSGGSSGVTALNWYTGGGDTRIIFATWPVQVITLTNTVTTTSQTDTTASTTTTLTVSTGVVIETATVQVGQQIAAGSLTYVIVASFALAPGIGALAIMKGSVKNLDRKTGLMAFCLVEIVSIMIAQTLGLNLYPLAIPYIAVLGLAAWKL